MKTLSSYISKTKMVSEAASVLRMPDADDQVRAICSKNALWKALDRQCAKAGYALDEAYNELYSGKLSFTRIIITQTRMSQPTLTGEFTRGKGVMKVNVAGRGYLGGSELKECLKELQAAADLAAWIDKQDLTKLPCFEMVDEEPAAPKAAPKAAAKAFSNYEVAYKMFDRKGQIVSKRKSFKTSNARAKFVEKIKQDGNFYDIIGYSED